MLRWLLKPVKLVLPHSGTGVKGKTWPRLSWNYSWCCSHALLSQMMWLTNNKEGLFSGNLLHHPGFRTVFSSWVWWRGNNLLRGKPYQGPKNEEVDATCSHPSFSGWSEHCRRNLRLSCLIIYLFTLSGFFFLSFFCSAYCCNTEGLWQWSISKPGVRTWFCSCWKKKKSQTEPRWLFFTVIWCLLLL